MHRTKIVIGILIFSLLLTLISCQKPPQNTDPNVDDSQVDLGNDEVSYLLTLNKMINIYMLQVWGMTQLVLQC